MTVDRFEAAGLAVLEWKEGAFISLPHEWLPRGTREGDVLRATVGGEDAESGASGGPMTISFRIDHEATRERRQQAAALRDRLPRAGEGDIAL